jgi:hypothetical protein
MGIVRLGFFIACAFGGIVATLGASSTALGTCAGLSIVIIGLILLVTDGWAALVAQFFAGVVVGIGVGYVIAAMV